DLSELDSLDEMDSESLETDLSLDSEFLNKLEGVDESQSTEDSDALDIDLSDLEVDSVPAASAEAAPQAEEEPMPFDLSEIEDVLDMTQSEDQDAIELEDSCFTPLEGLLMGTRSGDIDPAIVLQIMSKEDLSLNDATTMLNKHSGLQGISGLSSDMREIEEEYKSNERARIAHDIFTYRIKKYIGAYSAAMKGVDILVFTGGIGENSAMVRKNATEGLGFFGNTIDDKNNKIKDKNEQINSADDSKVKCYVIQNNEELVIALDTMDIVNQIRKKSG
ncbi:MAG: hypothetical protein P8X42_01765, partial [Calditrichaceae bacterium]